MHFVIQHFIRDECLYVASALAFTTLLAIVPLMSAGFAVFSTFPVFQSLSERAQTFIFENFIPSTGKVVLSYLQQFSAQVTKLSVVGVIFLVMSALLVMFTIEQTMNKIWRVKVSRNGISAFLLYWVILSLAPAILGFSLAASSYLFSLPFLIDHPSPSFFLHVLPFLFSLTGFWFLYAIVPNCPVKTSHAFGGGLFAAILFEMTKQGFAWYLSIFNTYELLYGAFSFVPIFCIWIYLVWVITLLGAEISYAFSAFHSRQR